MNLVHSTRRHFAAAAAASVHHRLDNNVHCHVHCNDRNNNTMFATLSTTQHRNTRNTSRCCDNKSCGNRNETPSDPVITDR